MIRPVRFDSMDQPDRYTGSNPPEIDYRCRDLALELWRAGNPTHAEVQIVVRDA